MNKYLNKLENNVKNNYSKYKLSDAKIKPYWNTALKAYKETYNFNLSKMKYILDIQPHYNDGRIATDMDSLDSAGSWTKKGIIYLNPNMYLVFIRYAPSKLELTDEIFKSCCFRVILHELAHEVYNHFVSEEFKNITIQEAIDNKFSTEYTENVKKQNKENKYREELFCEYLACMLVKKYINEV